jgi:cytidine deaminase
MTQEQRSRLIAAALEVQVRAYAPYSKFHVGAAILTADGEIFAGCNVENASYGLTICAERVAAATAVAAGHRQFAAVAIASPAAAFPCGACRQVLAEFGGRMPILLIDASDPEVTAETDLHALLPAAFTGPLPS